MLGTTYDAEFTAKLKMQFRFDTNVGNAESGGYTHHAIATFEYELNDSLDIDISFVWDRILKPTADSAGVVPEPDDYKMLQSVGFSF